MRRRGSSPSERVYWKIIKDSLETEDTEIEVFTQRRKGTKLTQRYQEVMMLIDSRVSGQVRRLSSDEKFLKNISKGDFSNL